jgi:excinuclease UvrABC ATPase subunit
MVKKKEIELKLNTDSRIVLEWVKTHNLKNIDVTIPKNKLITITW